MTSEVFQLSCQVCIVVHVVKQKKQVYILERVPTIFFLSNHYHLRQETKNHRNIFDDGGDDNTESTLFLTGNLGRADTDDEIRLGFPTFLMWIGY